MRKVNFFLTCLGLLFCLFVEAYALSNFPELLGKVVDLGLVQMNKMVLYQMATQLFQNIILFFVAASCTCLLASTVSTSVANYFRERLFSKIMTFSFPEYDLVTVDSLLQRTLIDTKQIERFLFIFCSLFLLTPILFAFIVFRLINTLSLSILVMVVGIGFLVLLIVFTKLLFKRFELVIKMFQRLHYLSRESIEGVTIIKARGQESVFLDKYERTNRMYVKYRMKYYFILDMLGPLLMILVILFFGYGLITFAPLILSKAKHLGSFVSFIFYFIELGLLMKLFLYVYPLIPQAIVSRKRIMEILTIHVKVTDQYNPVKFRNRIKGQLELKNVSFQYHNADYPVLKDVSLSFKKGESVGILGVAGSGKSTLVHLMLRLLDPTTGEIKINDVELPLIEQNILRSKVVYVSQNPVLFEATVEQNIKFSSKRISSSVFQQVLKIAEINVFVNKRKKKLNELVLTGGTNFTDSQKQRICLSRALVRDADVYIFDDCFAYMNEKMERRIMTSIQETYQNKILIFVSSRVKPLKNLPRVVVLKEGEVVGDAGPAQLLKISDVYQELVSSQEGDSV